MGKVQGYLKKLAAAVLTLSMLPCVSYPVQAATEVTTVDLEDIHNYRQSFTYVDLRSVMNRGFADDAASDGIGGWADQGPTNDMSCYKDRGIVDYNGIKFDIVEPNQNNGNSAIVLRGQNDASVPDSVEIAVDAKCEGLYFLHASPWLNKDEDVGSYTLVYEDGTEHTVELQGGQQSFNWWGTTKSDYATIVWQGNNDSSTVSLTLFPVANPNPEKKISKIVAKTIGAGPYNCIVAITLTDAGPYLPKEKEVNIGNPDTSDWYPYQYVVDSGEVAGTALDMSYLLDAPAGKHGYITTDGEDMYFEDGTRFNAWGISVAGAEGMCPDYDEAEIMADRIAQLGFNTARFHITTFSTSTKAGFDLVDSSTRRTGGVSLESMDKFCYLLKCLKDRGIYYGMDLQTGGMLWLDNNLHDTEYMDGLTRGANFFDEDVVKLLDQIAENVLTYKNPYTGMTIGEDPAFLFASMYNETGFMYVDGWENWDYYYPHLKELYNNWLLERYPTRADLEAAWTEPESNMKALQPNEDQTKGTVELDSYSQRKKANNRRYEDALEFTNSVFATNMVDRFSRIREWAPHALLTGTTCFTSGRDDLGNFYVNAKYGDFYSEQCYFYLAFGNGEHTAAGTSISEPKPALIDNNINNLRVWVYCNIYGKPYFQTEWDNGMPNPYRSEYTLLMSAFSQFQNWNPFLFAWSYANNYKDIMSETEKGRYVQSQHETNRRPEMVHALPAMALITMRDDVTEAEKGYYPKRMQNNEVFNRNNQYMTADGSWAWVGKSGGKFVDDIAYDPDFNDNDMYQLKLEGDKTGIYNSYTNELSTNINTQVFQVNTERTQAASGKIDRVELQDVIFDIENDFSTVYLQSRDEETTSIHDASRLLMTLVGDTRMTGQKMTEDGREYLNGGTGPLLCEPIKGTITIKSQNDYEVWALKPNGQRKFKLATTKTPEGYTQITTQASDRTMSYEIIRTKEASVNPVNEKVPYVDESVYDDFFTDLGAWQDDKDKIERIYMQGFMNEVAPGRIAPEQPITRGAAANLLASAFGYTSDEDPGFLDVNDAHEYYKQICGIAKYGVIIGDENGNFRPDEPVTRQDFLLMMKKALDKSLKGRTTKNGPAAESFSDYYQVSDYAKPAVTEMIALDYPEFENNEIRPKDYMARGDVCVLLYNILWE